MNTNLPKVKKTPLLPEHFPTVMQAFIFRNWEMVNKEKLARMLGTSVENVEQEARRMGLGEQGNTDIWMEKGYITIIRSNWHLLPYEQLLQLLDWTEEQLAFVLKEEDFLDIKLGELKPECEPVCYQVLTEAQLEETERIRAVVQSIEVAKEARAPFDFWGTEEAWDVSGSPKEGQITLDAAWYVKNETGDKAVEEMGKRFAGTLERQYGIPVSGKSRPILLCYTQGRKEEYHVIEIEEQQICIMAGGSGGILRGLYRLEDMMRKAGGPYLTKGRYERTPRFDTRYIYSFCALYGNALDVDSSTWCPDSLLENYARVGVNGIWLQAVLYRVTEFPFAPEISEGWEQRQDYLRKFVERARTYGIKIYLYINEPRTMPLAFFERYPEMKGAVAGEYACMCLSSQRVRDYLGGAMENLCRAVPGLGGFFTITMSENLTHCKSREVDSPCPHCAEMKPWELAALANRVIADGAHRADPGVKVFAWDWAWTADRGFEEGDARRGIEALPRDVAVLCKRESEIPYVRGGITGRVQDYAMSVEGLSPVSLDNWKAARDSGHEVAAKVQVNNTWECSTTPYLPVFGILENMMDCLIQQEIRHLMLSWTLGGYPSPNIRLISEAFFEENGRKQPDYDGCLRTLYGAWADRVRQATAIFGEAFREFPFALDVLYNGPQNGGVSNLFYAHPTGYQATMTCYAYDDLEGWRANYPADILEAQFGEVARKWSQGLALLEGGPSELADISLVSYSLFQSSYHQVRFVKLRDAYLQTGESAGESGVSLLEELIAILQSECRLTRQVHEIMQRRPEVGFEAANHYYYSCQMLLEKIVNCESLIRYYSAEKSRREK